VVRGAPPKPLSSMAISVHEAGHAVAHYLYKIPMTHVSIVSTERTTAHVLHIDNRRDERLNQNWSERRSRAYAERLIRCALAGGIAQKKYRPSSFDEYHASLDWDNALQFAATQSGSLEEAMAWCHLLSIQTKQELLLQRNWTAVMCLARELRSAKFLPSRAVRRIIEAAWADFFASRE
jgi:hypothetical protein